VDMVQHIERAIRLASPMRSNGGGVEVAAITWARYPAPFSSVSVTAQTHLVLPVGFPGHPDPPNRASEDGTSKVWPWAELWSRSTGLGSSCRTAKLGRAVSQPTPLIQPSIDLAGQFVRADQPQQRANARISTSIGNAQHRHRRSAAMPSRSPRRYAWMIATALPIRQRIWKRR
jgi:hypothetical protein